MTPERRRYFIFGILAAVTVILDQWTKVAVRETIRPLGYAGKQLIDHYVVLRFSENKGVAFGMLQGLPAGRIILTLVALTAFVLVILYLRRIDPSHKRLLVALGLVGGGAAGNLIDRIALGGVTDFMVVDLGVWPLNPWPAFNVADAALVVGVGLMAIDMARAPKQSQPAAAEAPKA